EEYVYENEEDWADDWGDMGDFNVPEYTPKPKKFQSSLTLAIGFHTLLNTPSTAPEINFFKSGMFEFGFINRFRIGADNSPFWYNIGLSYVNNGVRWKGNSYILDRDIPTFTENSSALRRNRLTTDNIVLNTGFAYIQDKIRILFFEVNGFLVLNVSTYNEIQ